MQCVLALTICIIEYWKKNKFVLKKTSCILRPYYLCIEEDKYVKVRAVSRSKLTASYNWKRNLSIYLMHSCISCRMYSLKTYLMYSCTTNLMYCCMTNLMYSLITYLMNRCIIKLLYSCSFLMYILMTYLIYSCTTN